MRANRRYLFVGVCALMIVSWLSGVTISGERVTITGTIDKDYQLVAKDGLVYIVADIEKGNEMVLNCIGMRVKTTGIVEEIEGVKIITITSYEAIVE